MAINYLGINPIAALFWTAVINGVLAPPLLVLIMLISNNQNIMGGRVNNRAPNVLGWATQSRWQSRQWRWCGRKSGHRGPRPA